MSCNIHFDPRSVGTLVCGCGWNGDAAYADYQWELVGSDVKEPIGWEMTARGRVPLEIEEHNYEPITAEADALADTLPVTRKRKEDKRARPEPQDIGEEQLWSCHCPKCGANLKEEGLKLVVKDIEKIDWIASAWIQSEYHDKGRDENTPKEEWCSCVLCRAMAKHGLKEGEYVPFLKARRALRAVNFVNGKPINWEALYEAARAQSEEVYAQRKLTSNKWVDPVPELSTTRSLQAVLRMEGEANLSVWKAEQCSSALFFEVERALVPPRGKKPRYKDFKVEQEYFDTLKAWKAAGRDSKYAYYSIQQLYEAKAARNPDTAYDQVVAILEALGIDPMTDSSCKFQLVHKASKIGDVRKKASVALAKRMGVKVRLKDLLMTAFDLDSEQFAKLLFGLYEEFGDVSISKAAVKALKREPWAMWSVRRAGCGAYAKKTYKHKAWMEEHPEVYESMEYSMDRGALETTEDGSVWVYDSVWKGMEQVFQGMEREPTAMGRGQSSWKLIDLVPFSDDWQGGQLEERQEEEESLEFYDPEGEGEEVEAEVEVAVDLEDSAVA